jgi:TatD DNase family protein
MHLDLGKLRENVRGFLEPGPIELNVLARRKVPVAAVVATRNVGEPAQLPRIGAVLAAMRGVTASAIAQATRVNAQRVLPQLQFFETL